MFPKESCFEGLVPSATMFRRDRFTRAQISSVDLSIYGIIDEWTIRR
jgi:hypothetical protein